MPRKKGRTVGTRTLIVRLGERQDDDLRAAAAGLGLDVSNLVRLIFTEQLPAYLERGRAAEARAAAARPTGGPAAGGTKRSKRSKRSKRASGAKGGSAGSAAAVRFLDL